MLSCRATQSHCALLGGRSDSFDRVMFPQMVLNLMLEMQKQGMEVPKDALWLQTAQDAASRIQRSAAHAMRAGCPWAFTMCTAGSLSACDSLLIRRGFCDVAGYTGNASGGRSC